MNTINILVATPSVEPTNSISYLIGAIIALLILGYLLYSLIKPEKF